ncbi:glycosyltransferase [Dictyobacter formicarum]|uniref:Glycosyltransferase 2-like domain-containing protein n=1 Tax=Dictyobacter formicarum TaxID=2778368 RepID=A0ABQ3VUG6_9CHLR|nr:glycosyltransferase [Dictyobacter formicarum]GHO88726.1 hypothetical protein KSZ_67320 [Dictyobacter formicarum]
MTIHHPLAHSAHISIRTRSTGAFRASSKEQSQTGQHMLKPPRFSVVICTYNRRNMMLSLLASLRRQSLPFKYFEVIVVDNGSVDGTFNAVQTYLSTDALHRRSFEEQWSVQCLLEKRNGLAYARNTALAAACGEVIVFLDDDVLVDQYFLEQLWSAYEETQADAIGGRVDLYWESPRPYWLTNDLLEVVGYYMPFRSRTRLPDTLSFSNSCFSIKRTALQQVGGFSPFLTKRLNNPVNMETADLCRRLRQQHYTLWYEPAALVLHRVSRARLSRPFLVGRAYWQGRSEILAQYADAKHDQDAGGGSFLQTLLSLWPETKILLQIFFAHRLLLALAHQPTSERLIAAMAQAHSWGRIQQQFMLSNHAPAMLHTPCVLFVQAQPQDAVWPIQALHKQGIQCSSSIASIPFSWIWRHRAYQETALGIIHFYQPGALSLHWWQRQQLFFKLWLARRLGIGIVSTDAGGYWHNAHGLQAAARRAFENKIFDCSHLVLTFTRHADQFYQTQSWWTRSTYLAHPGMREILPQISDIATVRQQLGIQSEANYVYLCLAYLHTEREVIQCMEAFSKLRIQLLKSEETASFNPQLLLVGTPVDKKQSFKILKRAALNSAIHVFLEYRPDDLATYVAATNALVLPYTTVKRAGVPELAMLFYSYECIVISPNLPRFHGLLPHHGGILYTSGSQSSLVQAMLLAPKRAFKHTEKEAAVLHHQYGWRNYALLLLDTYKTLLSGLIKRKS